MFRYCDPVISRFLSVLTIIALVRVGHCIEQSSEDVAPWRIENETEMETANFNQWIRYASLTDLMLIPGISETIAKLILKLRDTEPSFEHFSELINLLSYSAENEVDFEMAVTALRKMTALRMTYITKFQYSDPIQDNIKVSPYRVGSKIRLQRDTNLTINAVVEKDPGEELFWDYSSFSIKANLPAREGYFILGDFSTKIGHGLVVNTQNNFGLGSSIHRSLLIDDRIFSAHKSWDENIALRGGALSLNHKILSVDLWVSQRERDVHLDENGFVTSFSYTGLHQTNSEMDRSNICLEDALGGRIGSDIVSDRLNLGITYSAVRWNKYVLHNGDTIDALKALGLDFKLNIEPIKISAETSLDRWQHLGVVGVVQSNFDNLRQLLAIYHIQPDYYSPLSSSLDFDYGEVGNREGVYTHAKLRWDWGNVSGFMHLYRYPRRVADQAWGGRDFYLTGTGLLNRKLIVGTSSRWTQEDDVEDDENILRWRGSTSLSYQFNKRSQVRTKLQLCTVPDHTSPGWLVELSYSNGWQYSPNLYQGIMLKAGLYHADNYSQRLYLYETDLSGSFRFRALWERGTIFQFQTWIRQSLAGHLEISLIWDQPNPDSDRNSSRTIKIVYRYS